MNAVNLFALFLSHPKKAQRLVEAGRQQQRIAVVDIVVAVGGMKVHRLQNGLSGIGLVGVGTALQIDRVGWQSARARGEQGSGRIGHTSCQPVVVVVVVALFFFLLL